jgi:hypothetical protein
VGSYFLSTPSALTGPKESGTTQSLVASATGKNCTGYAKGRSSKRNPAKDERKVIEATGDKLSLTATDLDPSLRADMNFHDETMRIVEVSKQIGMRISPRLTDSSHVCHRVRRANLSPRIILGAR